MKLLKILLVCLLISCVNRTKKNANIDGKSQIVIQPTIDSILKRGIAVHLETINQWEGFDTPPLRKSCLVMEFKLDPQMKGVFFSDSTVLITHKICKRDYPLDGYKGILTVDSIQVAIFDKSNMGIKFYNVDSLKTVPFSAYECYSATSVPGIAYYIRDGKLKYWNP